jgi:hypothetical protein
MQSVFFGLFLVGMVLLAIANFGHRRATAPAVGSGPFVFPWQAGGRYTPLGFRLHLLGHCLWALSAVFAAISLA